MKKKVLVTGGAGFIGSHLVDALILAGHSVRVLDNLDPQVHGSLREEQSWPMYASASAEYILGDIQDLDAVSRAIEGIEIVYHLAALTGVGQSMYQMTKYTAVNIQGTANLLESLNRGANDVEKVILASSRAVYGEGLYHCAQCGQVSPHLRTKEALEQKDWEIHCPNCNGLLEPVPTPESKPPDPGSVYAVTKLAQEQLCNCYSLAHDIPAVTLRLFNVYGPRQSLTNPYTGIISTFLQRICNNNAPEVYEDGLMTRDFVYISDAVQASLIALETPQASIINIGSGQSHSILEIAQIMCKTLNPGLSPVLIGQARVGDIRHCTADLTLASKTFGYRPTVSIQEGLTRLFLALGDEHFDDQTEIAKNELRQAGFLK